jgi:hypothetical protein
MDDFIDVVVYGGIIIGMIIFSIVIAVLYWGAILWIILWVLKQFGILQHFGIDLLWLVHP